MLGSFCRDDNVKLGIRFTIVQFRDSRCKTPADSNQGWWDQGQSMGRLANISVRGQNLKDSELQVFGKWV